jgi:hypothetical protein
MNGRFNFRGGLFLVAGLGLALLVGSAFGPLFETPVLQPAKAQPMASSNSGPVNVAQPHAQAPGGSGPDQAHVMADVGYHFANLWFAAEKQNWPLANYYLNQTRSHLRWAVQLHPVRQTSAGADVNLTGILDAVNNSYLAEVGKAIENKDAAGFTNAYHQTLTGCYACHQACEKPFLRPQIPTAPSVSILNFDPSGTP